MPKSLQDVAEVHYGKSQNGVADKYGDFPIIGTGGFLGYARKPLFSGPAIVVGRKGTLNNPIYSPDDFWAVDTTYAVVPKENIHPKWLYFTLKNARLELLNEATGVPSLSRDRLFRVPVQDVEFLEQTRIAYVLDTIDEAIAQTESVIAKLKQVRAGMLHDLLSYGLDEHGQLRDPNAHPEQFKASPLGRIPVEWDVFEISTVGEIVTGRTPPASEPGSWGMEIPFITPAEITTDGVVLPPERLISAHGRNFTRELPANSILVVCIGSTLGKVAVTPLPCVTNQQINAIICEADYHHGFVSAMVNHHIRQLHRWAGLQAVPIVNKSQFGRMLIPVAPPTEQVQIAETLHRGASSILSQINECKKLKNFKVGIQDDLLTGRVRVPETIMEGAENA